MDQSKQAQIGLGITNISASRYLRDKLDIVLREALVDLNLYIKSYGIDEKQQVHKLLDTPDSEDSIEKQKLSKKLTREEQFANLEPLLSKKNIKDCEHYFLEDEIFNKVDLCDQLLILAKEEEMAEQQEKPAEEIKKKKTKKKEEKKPVEEVKVDPKKDPKAKHDPKKEEEEELEAQRILAEQKRIEDLKKAEELRLKKEREQKVVRQTALGQLEEFNPLNFLAQRIKDIQARINREEYEKDEAMANEQVDNIQDKE